MSVVGDLPSIMRVPFTKKTLLPCCSGKPSGIVENAETAGAAHSFMFPLEFYLIAVPLSLQASGASKERWKATVADAARQRAEETVEFIWLDDDPVAVTIFYWTCNGFVPVT